MQDFETKVAAATRSATPADGVLLGAIGTVVDANGKVLYHHAAGHQSLDADSPPLDKDSTVAIASAGKFVTHIAALQLVDRGLVNLDEPIYKHLPELKSLPLIFFRGEDGVLVSRPHETTMTLRHLLLHTSGISSHENPLVDAYLKSNRPKFEIAADAHFLVRQFSLPLIFEPGDGFEYGHSLDWTQLLVTRAAEGGDFTGHVKRHIFDPLGMSSSTYLPHKRADVWERRLRMVERDNGKLVGADDATQGLTCSMTDLMKLFADLLGPSSKLLSRDSVELLWKGQIAPGANAMRDLRTKCENYDFCTGRTASDRGPPKVNWSMGGLVAEEELPVSCIPTGSVVWEGMPNVMWAMNREKGIAAFFATQIIPSGDAQANELALTFMRDAFKTFA